MLRALVLRVRANQNVMSTPSKFICQGIAHTWNPQLELYCTTQPKHMNKIDKVCAASKDRSYRTIAGSTQIATRSCDIAKSAESKSGSAALPCACIEHGWQ